METVVGAVAVSKEFLETVVEAVAVSKEFLETVVETVAVFARNSWKPVSYTHLTLPTILRV